MGVTPEEILDALRKDPRFSDNASFDFWKDTMAILPEIVGSERLKATVSPFRYAESAALVLRYKAITLLGSSDEVMVAIGQHYETMAILIEEIVGHLGAQSAVLGIDESHEQLVDLLVSFGFRDDLIERMKRSDLTLEELIREQPSVFVPQMPED